MQEDKPLISVLMTAYNAEDYVSLAIESILEQTYKNFEFVIVEDCSKDRTWDVIQNYARGDKRVVAIRNKENLGAGGSSNKGIKVCRGKYIVRMDADDWSYPNRIERQVEYMEGNEDIVVSGGSIVVCNEDLEPIGVRRYETEDSVIRKKLLRLLQIPHPASIWRKDALVKTKLYPTDLRMSEDYALTLDISQYGSLGNIDVNLIKFRVHGKSESNSKMALQQKATLIISNRAVREYGYKETIQDRIWKLLQRMTMYTIPPKLKRWLLNRMVLDRDISKV